MTRVFCGMWEYRTQKMDYICVESFLARLIRKYHTVYICICDKDECAIAGMRCVLSDVYQFQNHNCVTGLILYDVYYYVKIDSLKNIYLVPIH